VGAGLGAGVHQHQHDRCVQSLDKPLRRRVSSDAAFDRSDTTDRVIHGTGCQVVDGTYRHRIVLSGCCTIRSPVGRAWRR
jgi:hypothetical protein